ncbi:MAG: type II secretion system protein [Acidimicrobiales bacterium]|nr:type II secretion system protein [Acidimicrobiales bacterium]
MIGHLHRHPGTADRGERGETLIELMATVILMGVSIVALVASLLAVMRTSVENRRATRAGNEAVNVVETLRGVDYIPCATDASYVASLPAAPRGYVTEITGLRRLQNADVEPPVWVAPSGGCTTANDTGAQEITVKVTATDGSDVSRSLSMVKRRKACPDAAPSDPELC